ALGRSATSALSVTVNQTIASISVLPASSTVTTNGTQQFTATSKDQFGVVFQPSLTWSASGGGTMSSSGLFTAGAAIGGLFTVTASSGGVSGNATVNVTGNGTDFVATLYSLAG